MRRTLAVHIYISIQRGLAVFGGTSRRKSFPGCSVLDRLCAERRLGNYAKRAQTRRVTVRSAGDSDGTASLQLDVWKKYSETTPDTDRMCCSSTNIRVGS